MAHFVGTGTVGKDTELRKAGQYDVADIAIAVKYGRADEETGRKPTQWVKATVWGNYAKGLAPHLLKGTTVYFVLEELHIETYQKRDGGGEGFNLVGKVVTMDIVSKAQPRQAPPQRPPARPPAARQDGFADMAPKTGGSGFDDMEDDLPF